MIETVIETEMPVNETFFIKKNRIKNGTSNKRFSLITGIHGDELEGQYCAYLLQKYLNENIEQLDGIIDIYPGVNPLGIDSITRGIPAFDLDMNRIFPGSEKGDMIEFALSKLVADIEGSTVAMDIHASNIYLTEVPQIRINEKSKEVLLPLALKSNVDFIWVHSNSTVLEATLAYTLNSRATPTLVVEMGVGMRITKEYSEQLVSGIFSILKKIGIWKGEVAEPRVPIVSNNPEEVIFLNSPCAGIFIKRRNHGDYLNEGDIIGEIINPLEGTLVEEIKAPAKGWLFTIREYPVVDTGSLMARILREE